MGAWPGWHLDSYLYGRVCVVLVGRVQGELDLEDLGSTQQQFLPLLSAPGAERILADAAVTFCATLAATYIYRLAYIHWVLTGQLRPLTLVKLWGVATVLFSGVSLHIHVFILTRRGRLGEGSSCALHTAPF